MKLSIALATFNGAQYLEEQLESFTLQTRLPDELIVVDDHSSDETPSILRAFARTAHFPVRISRNCRNFGSRISFQRAISQCSGNIIFFADQDDVWRGDKLQRIETEFKLNPACVGVFSNAKLVDENRNDLGKDLWQRVRITSRDIKLLARGGELATRFLIKKNCVTGATFAFRAEFKEYVTPVPADWVHDEWIALLLTSFGGVVGLYEELIEYRQHPNNQLGIRQGSIRERASDSQAFPKVQYKFQSAAEQLAQSAYEWPEYLTVQLAEKSLHLEKRTTCHGKRLRSMAALLPELLSGRYHLYSNGLLSFLKDVA